MADNTTPTHDSAQRLNKFVALALGVSRRQADELIERGKVTVNDQPAKLGQRVTTADIIRYGNKPLTAQTHQLILLHKPVGRLDKDSSGLILLTNDGDFAHQMTHPSFYKIKRYLVTLDRPLQPLHRQMINDFGVQLPDGPSRLTLERQHDGDDHRWIVQMSEGRNRQIRRTFAALGYTVTKLHRTDFGNYTLGDIKRGEFQESKLTPSQ